MSFNRKVWTNRMTEYPNRRRLTREDGTSELVTVAREEGKVSKEGDPFSEETMNDLEQRINDGFDDIAQITEAEIDAALTGGEVS